MTKSGFEGWAQRAIQDALFPKAACYRLTHGGVHATFICWICGHRHLVVDQVQGMAESCCVWCLDGDYENDLAVM